MAELTGLTNSEADELCKPADPSTKVRTEMFWVQMKCR